MVKVKQFLVVIFSLVNIGQVICTVVKINQFSKVFIPWLQ